MAKATKLPSGNWRVQVYVGKDASGKKQYKSVTHENRRQAELMAIELQLGKQKNNIENLTLDAAINNYIADKSNILSPSTIRGYKTIQRTAFASISNLPLRKITEAVVQKQMNINAPKFSAKTISNQYGLLTVVLKKYKIKLEDISIKPKQKNERKIPTFEEIKQLVNIVENTIIELPVLFALLLGLRQSEIRALKWENLSGNSIKIIGAIVFDENNKAVYKKENKSYSSTRELTVPDYLMAKLEVQRKSSGQIYEKTPSVTLKTLKKLLLANNMPPYTMHELRHANASIMLTLGVPDKYAMERLGQNSPYMLKNVYQHIFKTEEDAISDQINEFFNKKLSEK